MQQKTRRLAASALAAVGAVGLSLGTSGAASAASWDQSQATLNPLNKQDASGSASVALSGNTAKVTVNASGLASKFMGGPFPHAQHFHIKGQGQCPTMADDKSGDGVVSTVEGQPAYGKIGASLTTKGDTSPKSALAVKRFPGGSSFNYQRTFEVSDAVANSIESGNAVVVVHGLDPATMSKKAQKEKSQLDKSLPLAATAPALCGPLATMPSGGVGTGGGSTAGIENGVEFGLGGAALAGALAMAVVGLRRRRTE
ncbi:MAG: hypothetical protein ACRDMV_16730 [Streptosporangiales bacterium]